MTYLLLGVPFLLVAGVVLVAARVRSVDGTRRLPSLPAIGLALAVLLVMTAVFDNIMIGIGLVDYGDDLILGVRIGVAPIEDFFYTIAAALLLPALWHLLAPARKDDR